MERFAAGGTAHFRSCDFHISHYGDRLDSFGPMKEDSSSRVLGLSTLPIDPRQEASGPPTVQG